MVMSDERNLMKLSQNLWEQRAPSLDYNYLVERML